MSDLLQEFSYEGLAPRPEVGIGEAFLKSVYLSSPLLRVIERAALAEQPDPSFSLDELAADPRIGPDVVERNLGALSQTTSRADAIQTLQRLERHRRWAEEVADAPVASFLGSMFAPENLLLAPFGLWQGSGLSVAANLGRAGIAGAAQNAAYTAIDNMSLPDDLKGSVAESALLGAALGAAIAGLGFTLSTAAGRRPAGRQRPPAKASADALDAAVEGVSSSLSAEDAARVAVVSNTWRAARQGMDPEEALAKIMSGTPNTADAYHATFRAALDRLADTSARLAEVRAVQEVTPTLDRALLVAANEADVALGVPEMQGRLRAIGPTSLPAAAQGQAGSISLSVRRTLDLMGMHDVPVLVRWAAPGTKGIPIPALPKDLQARIDAAPQHLRAGPDVVPSAEEPVALEEVDPFEDAIAARADAAIERMQLGASVRTGQDWVRSALGLGHKTKRGVLGAATPYIATPEGILDGVTITLSTQLLRGKSPELPTAARLVALHEAAHAFFQRAMAQAHPELRDLLAGSFARYVRRAVDTRGVAGMLFSRPDPLTGGPEGLGQFAASSPDELFAEWLAEQMSRHTVAGRARPKEGEELFAKQARPTGDVLLDDTAGFFTSLRQKLTNVYNAFVEELRARAKDEEVREPSLAVNSVDAFLSHVRKKALHGELLNEIVSASPSKVEAEVKQWAATKEAQTWGLSQLAVMARQKPEGLLPEHATTERFPWFYEDKSEWTSAPPLDLKPNIQDKNMAKAYGPDGLPRWTEGLARVYAPRGGYYDVGFTINALAGLATVPIVKKLGMGFAFVYDTTITGMYQLRGIVDGGVDHLKRTADEEDVGHRFTGSPSMTAVIGVNPKARQAAGPLQKQHLGAQLAGELLRRTVRRIMYSDQWVGFSHDWGGPRINGNDRIRTAADAREKMVRPLLAGHAHMVEVFRSGKHKTPAELEAAAERQEPALPYSAWQLTAYRAVNRVVEILEAMGGGKVSKSGKRGPVQPSSLLELREMLAHMAPPPRVVADPDQIARPPAIDIDAGERPERSFRTEKPSPDEIALAELMARRPRSKAQVRDQIQAILERMRPQLAQRPVQAPPKAVTTENVASAVLRGAAKRAHVNGSGAAAPPVGTAVPSGQLIDGIRAAAGEAIPPPHKPRLRLASFPKLAALGEARLDDYRLDLQAAGRAYQLRPQLAGDDLLGFVAAEASDPQGRLQHLIAEYQPKLEEAVQARRKEAAKRSEKAARAAAPGATVEPTPDPQHDANVDGVVRQLEVAAEIAPAIEADVGRPAELQPRAAYAEVLLERIDNAAGTVAIAAEPPAEPPKAPPEAPPPSGGEPDREEVALRPRGAFGPVLRMIRVRQMPWLRLLNNTLGGPAGDMFARLATKLAITPGFRFEGNERGIATPSDSAEARAGRFAGRYQVAMRAHQQHWAQAASMAHPSRLTDMRYRLAELRAAIGLTPGAGAISPQEFDTAVRRVLVSGDFSVPADLPQPVAEVRKAIAAAAQAWRSFFDELGKEAATHGVMLPADGADQSRAVRQKTLDRLTAILEEANAISDAMVAGEQPGNVRDVQLLFRKDLQHLIDDLSALAKVKETPYKADAGYAPRRWRREVVIAQRDRLVTILKKHLGSRMHAELAASTVAGDDIVTRAKRAALGIGEDLGLPPEAAAAKAAAVENIARIMDRHLAPKWSRVELASAIGRRLDSGWSAKSKLDLVEAIKRELSIDDKTPEGDAIVTYLQQRMFRGALGDVGSLDSMLLPGHAGPRLLGMVPDADIEDFIDMSLSSTAAIYARQVGHSVAMAETMGDPSGVTGIFEAALAAYRQIATATPDFFDRGLMADELLASVQAAVDLRDVVLQRYGLPHNPDAVSVRTMQFLTNSAVLSQMGTSFLSALTDQARIVMAVGVSRLFDGVAARITAPEGFRLAADEAAKAGAAVDAFLLGKVRTIQELQTFSGTRTALERAASWGAETIQIANLLAPWTEAMQRFGGALLQSEMIELAVKLDLDTASAAELERAAALGIDVARAQRIAEQWRQAGSQQVVPDKGKPLYLAATDQWTNDDLRVWFRASLKSAIDAHAVIKQQAADLPLFMRTPFGRMRLLYMGFAIAATQRVMIAALHQADKRALSAVLAYVGLAYMVELIREPRGEVRDPMHRALRAVERSGMLGVLPAFDEGLRAVTGGNLHVRAIGRNLPMVGDADMWKDPVRHRIPPPPGAPPGFGLAGQFAGPAVSPWMQAIATIPSDATPRAKASAVRRVLWGQNLLWTSWMFDELADTAVTMIR